jgi:hypothetical protein
MPTITEETYSQGNLVETRQVEVSQEYVNAASIRDKIEAFLADPEISAYISGAQNVAGNKATWDGLSPTVRQEWTRNAVLAARMALIVERRIVRVLASRFEADETD